MIPWVVLAACLCFPLPFSKTIVETAPAPPETGVGDVSSWTTTPSLGVAAGGDTAPPSSRSSLDAQALETSSSPVLISVTLSSNSFLAPSAAPSGHRETKVREARTATPTTTVLGQEGIGSAPSSVTAASTQRANRVVAKPEGGATDHVTSGRDVSSSLYDALTYGAVSNAVSRAAAAGSSMQSTHSSTGSPIRNFIYSRAAVIGGAADPWVSKALSTILNSVSLIVENALNNSAGGDLNSSLTTADDSGIILDAINSPSEPKIENRDDVFGNNSLTLRPSPRMTSTLPRVSTTTKTTTTKTTTTLKITSLPSVTSKTKDNAARTFQPTLAQSSTTTTLTRPSTTSPATTKMKAPTTTTSLRTSAATRPVTRPSHTTPTTATTSSETTTLTRDAVAGTETDAATTADAVTAYNAIVTLNTVTTAFTSIPSAIPDAKSLPYTTSLPDKSTLTYTTTLPDTTSLQDTTTIPDITALPVTTNSPDTSTIPDTATLPDATSLQDTTTIPDKTNMPDITTLSDTTNLLDTTTIADTTTISGTTTLPGTTNLPDTTTIPGTTTLPGTTNLPDTTTIPGTTTLPGTTNLPDTTTIPGTTTLPGTTNLPDTTTIPITVNTFKLTTIPNTPTLDLTTTSDPYRKAVISLEAQTTTDPPRKQDLIIFVVNYQPGLSNGYLIRNGTALWTNRFVGLPSERRLPPALAVFVNRLKEQQRSHTQEPDRLPLTPPPNPSPPSPVWSGESPRERSPNGEAFFRPSEGKSSAQATQRPAEGGFTGLRNPPKKTNETLRPIPRDPEARKFFFHDLLAEIIRRHWAVLDPWERHRRRQEDIARRRQAQLKADKMVGPPFRETLPKVVIPTTPIPDARVVFTEGKTSGADTDPRQVFVHSQLHTDPGSVPVLVVPSGTDQRQQFFRIVPRGDSVGKVIPSSNGNQPSPSLPTSQNWLSQLFQSMTDFGRRVSIAI